MHIVCAYPYARQIWMSLLSPRYVSSYFSTRLRDWVAINLKGNFGKGVNANWCILFGVAIWLLWGWRNSFTFDPNFENLV